MYYTCMTAIIVIHSVCCFLFYYFTDREQKSKEGNVEKDKRKATDNFWLISDKF